MNTLSTRIKDARKALGLSQLAVAKAAGVSQSAIANLEGGTRKQPRNLLPIALALGVRPEWLLNGKGPRSVAPPETPGDEALRRPEAHAANLAWAIETLGQAMAQIPERTRRTVISQLEALVAQPQAAREVGLEVELVVQAAKRRSA